MNFLLIDDDEISLLFIEELIKSINSDLTITTATNGKDGIEKFEKNSIDVVITDIMMPDTDGFKVIKKIRQIDKGCYIIALTALDDEVFKSYVLQKYIDDYFLKPIKPEEFLSKIDTLIKNHNKDLVSPKESLYYGHYLPFFTQFHIKNDAQIIHFMKLMDSFDVNSIELEKFAQIIKIFSNELVLYIEKSINYVFVTIYNLDFLEIVKEFGEFEYLSDSNKATFRFEILDKAKHDLLIKTTDIEKEFKKFEEEEEEEEEFFELDSEFSIDFSHNYEKIDAKTFVENSDIYPEEIDELVELNEELEAELYLRDVLSIEAIEEIAILLERYKKLFIDFVEINLAINELILILKDINVKDFDKDKNYILVEFFRALQNDLLTWIKNIFIEKSAKDVHYLDASILSSIAQIKSLLTQ